MKIHEQNQELKQTISKCINDIEQNINFLCSGKFTGTGADGEPKDWIRTGEVIAMMKHLRAEMQYVGSQVGGLA